MADREVADNLTSFFQSSLSCNDQETFQQLLTDFLGEEEQGKRLNFIMMQ